MVTLGHDCLDLSDADAEDAHVGPRVEPDGAGEVGADGGLLGARPHGVCAGREAEDEQPSGHPAEGAPGEARHTPDDG